MKMCPIGAPQDGPDLLAGSQEPVGAEEKWAVTGVNASVRSSLWHLKHQLFQGLPEEEKRKTAVLRYPATVRGKQFFRSSVKSLLGNEKRA